jgi:hypothetical protein
MLYGVLDQFGTGFDFELLHHAVLVKFSGPRRNVQHGFRQAQVVQDRRTVVKISPVTSFWKAVTRTMLLAGASDTVARISSRGTSLK